MELRIGAKGACEIVVSEADTALAHGSGTLRVLATPRMAALMEQAAMEAVAPYLEAGKGTVGTRLSISHDAATPVGMQVRAEAELIAVEGRKLSFYVSALDARGPIGGGEHTRFIIDEAKFLEITYS